MIEVWRCRKDAAHALTLRQVSTNVDAAMQGGPHAPTALEALRRAASAGAILAVVLICAPLPRALRAECDLCPPTCPMHHHHTHAADPGMSPRCHGAPNARSADTGRDPRVTRPPCGNHAAVAGLVVPPMILPSALPAPVVDGAARGPLADLAAHARLSEPPDTPPPILSA